MSGFILPEREDFLSPMMFTVFPIFCGRLHMFPLRFCDKMFTLD